MIEAYAQGKDIYATTAALVYNVPYEHCLESYGKEGKSRRTSMKSVILGKLIAQVKQCERLSVVS
jgi:DNA polymerase I-like protein with 3'-5' exonuclease and polymerase domains